MTPDKCEHQEKDDNTGRGISWIEPLNDGAVCDTCGQRFVPSDVLEEARASLQQLKTALEDGSELWGPDLGKYIKNYGPHEYLSDAFAVLRRIEEVLR